MANISSLPQTMKALIPKSTSEPPAVEEAPVPQPTIASAVVQILAANVISYMRKIYNGERNYPFPMPLIPGSSAVGRVAAVGPYSTKLKPGDLVMIDPYIRSRDDPTDMYLAGIHEGFSAGSRKLMMDVYRNWVFAEYCNCPLEDLALLDEKRLLGSPSAGGLGFEIGQLLYLSTLMVPYGGLRDIELKPGQTVIVAPATGPFGGAACWVAQAMGARVIAMGRNKGALEALHGKVPFPSRLHTVPITGDIMADCKELQKYGRIDAYVDIGPPEASKSTHIKSAILALSHGARISLMGGYREDIPIPHVVIMHKNIRLYGKWMYDRSDVADLIKIVENGMLDVSQVEVAGEVSLEQWKEAWDKAAAKAGFGQVVMIKPCVMRLLNMSRLPRAA